MRAHLIVFKSPNLTRAAFVELLDAWDDIPYWYYCLPYSVFVVTELSAAELSDRIDNHIDVAGAAYIIVEIDTMKAQGRLPEEAWWLINHPNNPRLPKKKKKKA